MFSVPEPKKELGAGLYLKGEQPQTQKAWLVFCHSVKDLRVLFTQRSQKPKYLTRVSQFFDHSFVKC